MKSILTLAFLTALLSSAHAATINIPVVGGTFEPSAVPPGTPYADPSATAGTSGTIVYGPGYYYQSAAHGTFAITGFTFADITDASGLFNTPYTNFGGHSGQAAFFNDDNAVTFQGGAGVVPTLTSGALTTIVAGDGYTASIDIGNQAGTGNYLDPGTVTLNLYANNVLVASNPTLSASLADDTWGVFSVSLTAAQTALLGGQTLTFQAVGDPTSQYNATSPASQPLFDDVTLFETTPNAVPEPSTWAMLLLSLGGLAIAVRRRQLS